MIKIRINIDNLITVLSLIPICYYFLPIVSIMINTTVMFYIFLVCFGLIIIGTKWNKKSNFLLNIIIIIIAAIFYLYRGYYKNGVVSSFYMIMYLVYPIFLGVFLRNKPKNMLVISSISILCIILTATTTYLGLEHNPYLSRELAAISDSSSPTLMYSLQSNIGGFDTVYISTLLSPVLYYTIEKKQLPMISSIFFKCLIFFLLLLFILQTQYTTALLLHVLIFMFSLIKKVNLKKQIIMFIMLMILFNTFSTQLSNIFSTLSNNISSNAISERFVELSETIQSGEISNGDLGLRSKQYVISIDTFMNHPIIGVGFGANKSNIGGHSTILDFLAQGGIVFFSIIIISFFYLIKNTTFKNNDTITYKYAFLSYFFFIVLAFINPVISGSFFSLLFLVFPFVKYSV